MYHICATLPYSLTCAEQSKQISSSFASNVRFTHFKIKESVDRTFYDMTNSR